MQEEIGKTAGAIWDALNTRGEQSLSELKKGVKGEGFESHLFEGRHPLAAAGMTLVINTPFLFERTINVYAVAKEA